MLKRGARTWSGSHRSNPIALPGPSHKPPPVLTRRILCVRAVFQASTAQPDNGGKRRASTDQRLLTLAQERFIPTSLQKNGLDYLAVNVGRELLLAAMAAGVFRFIVAVAKRAQARAHRVEDERMRQEQEHLDAVMAAASAGAAMGLAGDGSAAASDPGSLSDGNGGAAAEGMPALVSRAASSSSPSPSPSASGCSQPATSHEDSEEKEGLGSGWLDVIVAMLSGPTAWLLGVVLLVHCLRRSIVFIDTWFHTYSPGLPAVADVIIHFICHYVTSLDSGLSRLLQAALQVYLCLLFLEAKRQVVDHLSGWLYGGRPDELQAELLRTAKAVSSILSGVMAALTAFSVAGLAGVNLQPLLAVGGAGSVVAGLASQTVLANFAVGLTFLWERPFVPGEHVTLYNSSLSGNLKGVVQHVRMLRTVILTDDGTEVSVPNKMLSDMVISNRSHQRMSLPKRKGLPVQIWPPGPGPLLPSLHQLSFMVRLPKDSVSRLQEVESELQAALQREGGMPGLAASPSLAFAPRALAWRLQLRAVAFNPDGSLTAVARVPLNARLTRLAPAEQVQAAFVRMAEAVKQFNGTLTVPMV